MEYSDDREKTEKKECVAPGKTEAEEPTTLPQWSSK